MRSAPPPFTNPAIDAAGLSSAAAIGRSRRTAPTLSARERRRLFAQLLEDRRVPTRISVSPVGRLAFGVRRVDRFGFSTSVWTTGSGEPPRRLVAASLPAGGKDHRTEMVVDVPTWSPDGSLLAVAAADRSDPAAGRIQIFDSAGQFVRQSDPVATRLEALVWDGSQSVLAVGAELGADSVVTSGAVRYTAPARALRPHVSTPGTGRRRLYEASASGRVRAIGPRSGTIWELALSGGRNTVVVWSADPSESGWYHGVLSCLDRETGEVRDLYRPTWQLSPIAASAEHAWVAVIEGWSSDRGRVCGDARLIETDTGELICVPHIGVDLVTLAWRTADTLWFAGWRGLDAVWGWLTTTGRVGLTVTSAVKPDEMVFPAAPQGIVWSVSDPPDGSAPEVVSAELSDVGGEPAMPIEFTALTRLSRGQISTFAPVEVESLSWTADDGTTVQGLLVRSRTRPASSPLVVYVHGGPANLWNRSLSPEIRFLVDAGHAVLLANPRGSVGRGQDFATANLGDPGGRELTDLIAGVVACRRFADVDTRRAAIVGGSYGGYLAACGAAMTEVFRCAIVMFGHPDLLSARYGSNNPAFYDRLLLGDPASGNAAVYVDRSPIVHVSASSAPTLLLHGAEDRCCPVGQSEEMYRALADRGVDTELVVYPEEGHGLHGIDARTDSWSRTAQWLDRYLAPAESGTGRE